MQKRFLIFLFLIPIFILPVKAQSSSAQFPVLSDSAQVSLLTSTPWDEEVYALFGHTAIRIKDYKQDIDYVFNYGLFDFKSSNFIFRFIKGETDYMVGATDFRNYLFEYKERGVGVIEQVLNLSQNEKQDIFNALIINIQPENKVYRYNFFYDNCSTRPRDVIEKYVNGKIQYSPTNKEQTYRDLVHECVAVQPWTKFGIDMIIGADADRIITDRQKDFLPFYLLNAYKGAVIQDTDSTKRNLVLVENIILESKNTLSSPPYNEPIIVGFFLLAVAMLISFLSYKKGWVFIGKTFDTFLFSVAGIGGCIIFFLMYFSEHPCTNPNWNIIWLNPLQLIFAFLFFVKLLSKCVYYYHFINFVALTLFLLAWCLIPQQLEISFVPYIMSIWLRSGTNILQQRKLNKKAVYSLPKIRR